MLCGLGARFGRGEGRSIPEWAIQGFDGFGVEVFDGLFVAPADAVVGACVAVEGVYCLCDAHLGGCHGCG